MPNQIKIILNLPIYKSFDYLVPKHFRDLRPGMRVEVPFGTKNLIGMTITDPTIRNISENKYKLKNINKVIATSVRKYLTPPNSLWRIFLNSFKEKD